MCATTTAARTVKNDDTDTKSDRRNGNKGFRPGKFPRRGPFLILAPSGVTGRRYYLAGEYRARSEPAEGWMAYLVENFGEGQYKIEGSAASEPPAFIVVTPAMVARHKTRPARPVLAPPPEPDDDDQDDDDQDDDDQDDEPQLQLFGTNPAPPVDPVTALRERLEETERIRDVLGLNNPPEPPPEPDIIKTLINNPQLVQAALQKLLAPSAAPNPAPPPINPGWLALIGQLERHGIGPDQLAQTLARAAPSSPPPPVPDDGGPWPNPAPPSTTAGHDPFASGPNFGDGTGT